MHKATINGATHEVAIEEKEFQGKLNGQAFNWDVIIEDGRAHILADNKSYNVDLLEVNQEEKKVVLMLNGVRKEIQIKDRFDDLLTSLGMDNLAQARMKSLKAPMPGLVIEILVKDGQELVKDEPILILEAMKMENVIKAHAEGVVKKVVIEKGQAVEKNTVMVEFV